MPSTPTTKSQVQAYQFVLRRMQSALVRRDSVMLHDPMRTHSRATLVGFVLGALGVLGFVIFGLISPLPAVPDSGNIVIGKQSGTVYVVSGNPKTLTPTFNLASARLLLMSQGGASGQNVVEPSVVPDEQLKDIPRGRLTGIVDGPQLLPTASQRVSDNWAVCDNTIIDQSLPSGQDRLQAKTETTVIAGQSNLGRELRENEALLVKADDGNTYLIYRLQSNPNQPNANTVRARVDPDSTSVISALRLPTQEARHISMGLLNAIPAVGELTPPKIPEADNPTSFSQLAAAGLNVGDVFEVPRTGGATDTYVLLQNGIQQVQPAVGDLIRSTRTSNLAAKPPEISLDKINGIRQIQTGDSAALPVDTLPQVLPTVLDATQGNPVSCLGWTVAKPDGVATEEEHTAVYVGSQLPLPPGATPVKIGQPNPDGLKIDYFYMQPGRGAVVQSATSDASFGRGPISLISDRGLRYGVPDVNTAKGLGLDNARPAPDAIIKLLPTGASLNTKDVQKSYDSVPIDPNAGSFPPTNEQQQAASGSTGGN